ncbi:MAG: portal protein [Bacteroidales bacterium]
MAQKSFDIKAEHTKLWRQFTALRNSRNALEAVWIINFYSTFSREKYVYTRNGNVEPLDNYIKSEKYKEFFKTNKLLPRYRAIVSKIAKATPIIRVVPNSLDAANEFGTELAESLMKNIWQQTIKNGVQSRCEMWYVITGNAYTKTHYNSGKGDIIAVSGNEIIRKGEVEISDVSSFEIYYPSKVSSVEMSPKVFHTIILSREMAMKRWGNLLNKNEGAINATDPKYRILLCGNPYEIDTNLNYEDYIEIIEYYENPSDEYPEGRKIRMTERQILEVDILDTPDKVHPFNQAKFIDTGFGYGETPMSYLVSIDKAISLYRAQMAALSEKIANPVPCLPYKSQIKSEEFANRRVKVFRYDERIGKPFWLQPAELPQYFHLNLAKLEYDLEDISAIHDPSMARRPEGVRSGLMLAYMVEEDDQQHNPTIRNYFNMFAGAGKKALDLARKYYTEKRDIKIFGKDNIYYAKFEGKDLAENADIEINIVSGLPLNRVARQQILFQMGAAQILSPQEIRELMEFGEIESVFQKDFKDIVRQKVENNYIKNKEFDKVIIRKTENHLLHARVIIEWTKSSDFLQQPEEVQEFAMKHLQDHFDKAVELFAKEPLLAAGCMDATHIDMKLIQFLSAEIELYKKAEAIKAEKRAIALAKKQQAAMSEGRNQLTPEEIASADLEGNQEAQAAIAQERANLIQGTGALPPQIAELIGIRNTVQNAQPQNFQNALNQAEGM